MGRGVHETTKIKREIKLTQKTAVAIERAKKELDRKDFWKDFPKIALMEIIKKIDPLKFTATIALTPIVKMALDKAPEIFSLYQKLILIGSPIIGWIFTETVDAEKFKLDETFSWLVAFGVSYLVVENFGSILSSGGDIAGFVGKLFLV